MIRKATKDDTKSIAELHELILGDSIFVRLGRPFLEGFYYALLTEDRLAFAHVYEHEGRPVGFIAMAASHESFYGQIKHRAPVLAWSLIRSILSSPKTIGSILQAMGFLLKKGDLIKCDAGGELLQIAVHPDFRAHGDDGKPTKFFESTKSRVAQGLYLEAMKELKKRGIKDFRIMTGDGNVASNAFYSKMGAKKVESGIKIFGHPTSIYRANVEDSLGILHNTGL
jgi:N-acetylglutamate synthase-like GNAT family acetyltransferase